MLDVILPQIIKWKRFKQLLKNSSLVSLQTQQDLSGKFLFEVVQVLYILLQLCSMYLRKILMF